MDKCTNRNQRKWQCIAWLDVCICARENGFANFQTTRMKNVALLTVCIVKKSNACATVWIVFDSCNFSWNAILVALEIDYAVTTLYSATLMASSDTTVVVTAGLFRQWLQERLFWSCAGNVCKIRNSLEAPTGARGLVLFYSHFFPFYGANTIV